MVSVRACVSIRGIFTQCDVNLNLLFVFLSDRMRATHTSSFGEEMSCTVPTPRSEITPGGVGMFVSLSEHLRIQEAKFVGGVGCRARASLGLRVQLIHDYATISSVIFIK